jgi:hypothetical protein
VFRSVLAKHVAEIPAMPNRALREEHLCEKALEVVDKWQQDLPTFSNFVKNMISSEGLSIGESVAKDIVQALLSSAPAVAAGTTVSFATAGAGLIVAVVWYAAKRALHTREQGRKSPYRWLTRVHDSGATFKRAGVQESFSRLNTPLWESRVVASPKATTSEYPETRPSTENHES